MLRSIGKAVALLLAVALLEGCARGKAPVVYEPPVKMEDLASGLTAPDNAFALLSDVRTTGRFTCALAVAKFTPHDDQDGRRLVLEATRPDEQACWLERMHGVSALRGLVFLSPIDTRPEEPSITSLSRAAGRLTAPLLLVYVPNGVGANSAQVLGVLYDTATQQPLATLHASSQFLDEKGSEVSPNEEKGDHREIDARYQAQRAFEGQALACLGELIRRDEQPTTTQPHRWGKPLIERWWVPNRR